MADSMMDRFVRLLFNSQAAIMPEARQKQVAQFLNPDQEVLPSQSQRPTSLTRFGGQPYRSVSKYLPAGILLPDEVAGKPLNSIQLPMKLNAEKLYGAGVPAKGELFNEDMPLTRRLGLGGATTSIGKDDKGSPYMSIFDSWDDPSGLNFLDKHGTPFNVYDQIPIDLINGLMPSYQATRGRDIQLPIMPKGKKAKP